jgi:cation:H+ antiporter
VTLLAYVFLFVASVVVTLGACALFTNAIEWLGKRRNLSEGAVGSVLAAIGTTLPETSIPIVAIFFGATREEAEVGLGAILGAPFMLSTLVVPMLALLLLAYARLGKRVRSFRLNYKDITVDLTCFSLAYMVALGCAFVPSRPVHMMAAIGLLSLYGYYVKLKFSDDESNEPSDLGPLLFSKHATTPSYAVITLQALAGLGGLALGAHLFVSAADATAQLLAISPLILALLIAPLATELPEMSNSFLWLYQKKDRLAVGNVTGAMVFQGTVPVSVGLLGTEWTLAPSALVTMVLAVVATGSLLLQAAWAGQWRPWLLTIGAVLYIGYAMYLYGW